MGGETNQIIIKVTTNLNALVFNPSPNPNPNELYTVVYCITAISPLLTIMFPPTLFFLKSKTQLGSRENRSFRHSFAEKKSIMNSWTN